MGLPAFLLPLSAIDGLEDIVRASGISVIKKQIDVERTGAGDFKMVPNCYFCCTSVEGGNVIIDFAYSRDVDPGKLIIILRPVGSILKPRRNTRLMNLLAGILRQFGAMELGRRNRG